MAYKGFKNYLSDSNCIYVSVMNAKASRVYYGVYSFKNNMTNILINPTAFTIDELLNLLKVNYVDNNVVLVTDTVEEYLSIVDNFNIVNTTNIVLLSNNIFPDSNTITDYYLYLDKKDDYLKNTYNLDVEYVRTSSAERIKNGNNN